MNEILIGPGGRPAVVRETEGGDFFYRLHFDLRYVPILWGRWIVGFCTMFMLVAIVTGVITHKKIFADFFTFRPGKGQRSWMDGHNALAVLALPFHAMITYTGLITLMTIYMPWGVAANRAWLKGERRANPKWDRVRRFWTVPKAWFNLMVQQCLATFGSVYVVQPYREQEKCAPACWNALGDECQCSCMGEHHGSQGPAGRWKVVSDSFATRWGEKAVACRLIRMR